jgi:hypothetical protein
VGTRALRSRPEWRPAIPSLALLSWGALVPLVLLGRAHLRPQSLGGLYEKIFLAMELAWLLTAAASVSYSAFQKTVVSQGRPSGYSA